MLRWGVVDASTICPSENSQGTNSASSNGWSRVCFRRTGPTNSHYWSKSRSVICRPPSSLTIFLIETPFVKKNLTSRSFRYRTSLRSQVATFDNVAVRRHPFWRPSSHHITLLCYLLVVLHVKDWSKHHLRFGWWYRNCFTYTYHKAGAG